MKASQRRDRLERARLYLCMPLRDDLEGFLSAVLEAGVDVVQMRDKEAEASAQLRAAEIFRRACDEHDALFVVNDRPDLAVAAGADGVHVGQEDLPPEAVRAQVGPELLVGRSTHSVEQIERALHEPVDYLGVGPVHATPTKPGRQGIGLDPVRAAAARVAVPWFVTGAMDASTIPSVAAAGATRFVVVRAITQAADAAEAVRSIRRVLAPR